MNEGQQRFDTHVDKLMNYIRYWQASGESLKTSVRTRKGWNSSPGKVTTRAAPWLLATSVSALVG